MFERLNRWEYDHPVLVPLLTAGLFVVLALFTGDRLFVAVAVGVAGGRMWGLRRGGSTRRALERKYGWSDDTDSGA